MRTKHTGLMLSIGLGGHLIDFPARKEGRLSYGPSTLSGYYHDPDEAAVHSADDLATGAVVIDKRAALEADYRLAFDSPMCDVSLDEDEVDLCPQPSALLAGALAGNEFGALLALQEVAKTRDPAQAGPLDNISLKSYGAWWRDHGARVGAWNGTSIDWD